MQKSSVFFRKTVCSCIVGVVSLASAIALAMLGARMSPVRNGTAEEFWHLALGIKSNSDSIPNSGHAYFADDGWVAYTVSHFHGSDLYRVPEKAALDRFDAIKSALEQASEKNEDSPAVRGLRAWQAYEPENQTPNRLVNEIKRAQQEEQCSDHPYSIALDALEERSFWERWTRLKWRWASYAFEWTYLTCLALFVVWPGLHNLSRMRWSIHVGLFPLLFMLPVYLGYARLTFTSAGLTGGIVYPHLLRLTFGGYCTPTDRWLLAHTPPVLEPLSPGIGEWISLSGTGMMGPTRAIQVGVALAAAVLFPPLLWRWSSKRVLRKNDPSAAGGP